MTETVMNRSTIHETVSNVFDSIVRPVTNVSTRPVITAAVSAMEDAIDEGLLRAAIDRQRGRPLDSYRSLEDLMREVGD